MGKGKSQPNEVRRKKMHRREPRLLRCQWLWSWEWGLDASALGDVLEWPETPTPPSKDNRADHITEGWLWETICHQTGRRCAEHRECLGGCHHVPWISWVLKSLKQKASLGRVLRFREGREKNDFLKSKNFWVHLDSARLHFTMIWWSWEKKPGIQLKGKKKCRFGKEELSNSKN